MIKTIFIFFSYLAFLLLGVFNSDTVLIENNTPARIVPGVRSLVEVNVRKGDIQGFSKLELTLPAGFIATPGDMKGASFTFSGDKAKFVWMNLPEEQLFKVTYYIESQPNMEGAYEIKGTFSYVRENIREDIYVPTRTVVVQQEVEMPADAVQVVTPTVRVEQPVLEMSCERRIERLGDNEYLVRLRVNNNRIVGFGKILEVLPDNCSTNRDNDGGAVITQDANSIKFVWFEVPTAPSFEISYRIMCISDGVVPVIRGQLSYTENGNPFTVNVMQTEAPQDLQVSQSTVAVNTTQNGIANSTATSATQTAVVDSSQANNSSNTQQANTTSSTQADTSSNSQVAAEIVSSGSSSTTTNATSSSNSEASSSTQAATSNTQNSAQNSTSTQSNNSMNSTGNDAAVKSDAIVASQVETSATVINTVPSAEKGITYKVQILAAHRLVDKSYLKKKFSFEDGFNIENHNGWIKYTTGMYTQYKDARDARVKITGESSKLPGPFVTAYNNGERITVQEALLVSKQLWYN